MISSIFLNEYQKLQLLVCGQKAGHRDLSLYLVQLNTNILHYQKSEICVGFLSAPPLSMSENARPLFSVDASLRSPFA